MDITDNMFMEVWLNLSRALDSKINKLKGDSMGKVKSDVELARELAEQVMSDQEFRIIWLEQGLKRIASPQVESILKLRQIARAYLDGEPTTADEYNKLHEDMETS
jgi:hypothetical protein